MNLADIAISDYNYSLPDEKIAQQGLEQRDQSKLLILEGTAISEDIFRNIARHLPSDSLLVFNDTKVIHARLLFKKSSGAAIEIFCIEPHAPEREIQQAMQQKGWCEWKCMVGNARKWKSGKLQMNFAIAGTVHLLEAEMLGADAETRIIRLSWEPAGLSFAELLHVAGHVPLPPYMTRDATELDASRYQTVYAVSDGSVAAPTAGLHFTPAVFTSLAEKNISTAAVTLHVGAGTFKPVTSDTVSGHAMHNEQIIIRRELLEKLAASGKQNIIAVGTTTLRTLETIYHLGFRCAGTGTPGDHIGQWDAYEINENETLKMAEAASALIRFMDDTGVDMLHASTQMMIIPGYRIRSADILITNFHQPKSTLLLLIAAFVGEAWRDAYAYACSHDFRFLSYGDSCLFFRKG